jgi:H+/Cl- antiporter ClcA
LKRESKVKNNYKAALELGNEEWAIVLKCVMIGAISGCVVTLYRYVLAVLEEFCLNIYDFLRGNLIYLPIWIVALMTIAVICGELARRFKMIGGSGIPQVKGIIMGFFKDTWFSTLVAKFVGGALAVFAGLSLGREGPSIQLGACVAEGVGEAVAKSRTEKKILIAGGASAGLAAAFNAPLAGVIFAFEEIFKYFSPLILLSTTVSAVVADYVSKLFMGMNHVFEFGALTTIPLRAYWLFVPLGIANGLAGAFYNSSLVGLQKKYNKFWNRRKKWRIYKQAPVFALAIIVGLMFPLALCGGHIIVGQLKLSASLSFLAALLIVKFVFSIVSFASGAPGGIFFPLLIMGAVIGAMFGKIAVTFLEMVDANMFYDFVVISMAGFFTAIVRAPITGIVLLAEMTGSFTRLLPFTVVSIIAYVVANGTGAPPIYDSLLDNMIDKRKPEGVDRGSRIMIELAVHHGCAAEGKFVKDLAIPQHCLLVAIRRDDRDITPHGDTRINANDFITVLCDSDAEGFIRKFFADIFENPST